MAERPIYDMPPRAEAFMTIWVFAWLFLSLFIGGKELDYGIGGVALLWFGGSLAGSMFIVWVMGCMQERRSRDVFGAAKFADDRREVERAGLQGPRHE